MQKHILVLLSLFFTTVSWAQLKTDSIPPAKTKQNNTTANKEELERKDQFLMDLNYETFIFTDDPDGVDFRWYNRGFNAQAMYDYHVVKNRFTIGIGVGFSTQNYYGNGYLKKVKNEEDGEFYTEWTAREDMYKTNKLSVNHLEIPLELRYRSNIRPSGYQWKLTVGVKYGYMINIHDKLVDNDGNKYKTYNFSDVSDYRYGFLVRAGYGKVNLTAFYSMQPFIKDGKGSQMNQLSIGIGVTPF